MNHMSNLMPHPVLRPGGLDYKQSHFKMSLGRGPVRLGENLQLSLSYDLKSRTLENMIRDGHAQFCAVSECKNTHDRSVHRTNETGGSWIIPMSAIAKKMTVTPYVVSVGESRLACSEEHHEEFREMIPDGFELPAGSILAVGNPHEITLYQIPTIQAAITMSQKPSVKDGCFDIDLEDEYIRIIINPKTHHEVMMVRERDRRVLFPSLYLSAVTQAIRGLEDADDRKWGEALKKALRQKGIEPDKSEDLRHNSLIYAQEILEMPLMKLFRNDEVDGDD